MNHTRAKVVTRTQTLLCCFYISLSQTCSTPCKQMTTRDITRMGKVQALCFLCIVSFGDRDYAPGLVLTPPLCTACNQAPRVQDGDLLISMKLFTHMQTKVFLISALMGQWSMHGSVTSHHASYNLFGQSERSWRTSSLDRHISVQPIRSS